MAEAVEDRTRRVDLERIENFRFRVSFGGEMPDMTVDEPPPLGSGSAPDAARLLAAAVGNCLSASLTLCLQKSRVAIHEMRTSVALSIGRNDRGRLRVSRGDVEITLHTDGERPKLDRCFQMFEDYCTVTGTVRQAFPVDVRVVDGSGRELYHSAAASVTG